MHVEAQILNTPLYTSCAQINLRGVLFKEMEEPSSIIIIKTYNVILTNVTISDCSTSVIISLVHKLTLRNVKVINNSQSTSLLDLQGINTIKFAGDFTFTYNYGAGGIVLRQVKKVWTASNSTLRIEKNSYRLDLFLFEGDTELYSRLYINKNNTLIFEDNYVEGAVMHLDDIHLQTYNSKITFRRNKSLQTENFNGTIIPNAVLFLWNSECSFSLHSTLNFSHNTAVHSGGITLYNSTIQFEPTTMVYFEYNEGGDGAGMAFYKRSYIRRQQRGEWHNKTIDMHFCHNKARGSGGAIFVKDADYIEVITGYQHNYFVSTPIFEIYSPNIHLHFSYNTAKVSGNDLYGGRLDSRLIRDIFLLSWFPPGSSDTRYAIASDPIRICTCKSAFPICNHTDYPIKAYSGQMFQIEVVAVGQRMGIVPSVVTAEFSDGEGRLGEGQSIQGAGRECTALKFAIFSIKKSKTLNLKVRDVEFQTLKNLHRLLEGSKHQFLTQQLSVSVALQMCPLGFLFNSFSKTCSCLQSINLHSGVQCDYSTYRISKTKHKWLSATFEHNNTQHHGVIIYDQCPYDYCQIQTDADPLFFHLEFPDDQCAFNRSGVLCGACQTNFSHVLGTSRCLKCSNLPLLAIIPGVLFAGVALVIFLMLFNLTVSVGTINGLIFYANIIRASQAVFFPPEISSSFLSMFIAWLNLDLGIETCFSDGLDAYAKTWLQFVFPIYIWLIVIAIIVASHYSTRVSKVIPNNSLQVLATLFLLSYAKILRIVITVFSSTTLVYPDGFKKRVWLYDGNIEFFMGRHIPLCIATLFLLALLSIPYTLSLVSIQWLQKISHYRLLFWVNRLMPLFDAYTGPYKYKHRYWTGVLLLIRVIILMIFTLNQTNNPSINLITILVMSVALATYASYIGVYKSWPYNILEIISLLNSGFLSAISFYQLLNDGGLAATTSVSISVAFITFTFILLFHGTLQLKSSRKIRSAVSYLIPIVARLRFGREQREEEIDIGPLIINQELTHTSVELHELLLDDKDKEKN
jgi:predicted outer membrane repeat protein